MKQKSGENSPPICVNKTKRKTFYTLYFFLDVLAAALNAAAVGAPLVPGFLIFSPLPAAILAFLAAILLYNPGLLIILFYLIFDSHCLFCHKGIIIFENENTKTM
jgi:hypothetical protein